MMIKRLNRHCANNSLPKAPKLVVLYRALYPDGIKKTITLSLQSL